MKILINWSGYKTKLPRGVKGPVSSQDYAILTSSCSTAEASFERFNEYANIIFSNLGPFKTWGVQHQLCQPLNQLHMDVWLRDNISVSAWKVEQQDFLSFCISVIFRDSRDSLFAAETITDSINTLLKSAYEVPVTKLV